MFCIQYMVHKYCTTFSVHVRISMSYCYMAVLLYDYIVVQFTYIGISYSVYFSTYVCIYIVVSQRFLHLKIVSE